MASQVIDVDFQYLDDCPNWGQADGRLYACVDRTGQVNVEVGYVIMPWRSPSGLDDPDLDRAQVHRGAVRSGRGRADKTSSPPSRKVLAVPSGSVIGSRPPWLSAMSEPQALRAGPLPSCRRTGLLVGSRRR